MIYFIIALLVLGLFILYRQLTETKRFEKKDLKPLPEKGIFTPQPKQEAGPKKYPYIIPFYEWHGWWNGLHWKTKQDYIAKYQNRKNGK